MDWIKRNLYFLVGGAVALALMGMAGWFLYSKWQLNNTAMDQLNQDYEELRRLNNENPHPGSGPVDNIKVAKEQQQEIRSLIQKARSQFQQIPPIPDMPKLTDRDFSAALSRTLDQMQRDATNASVALLPNYHFSFEAQNSRVTFAANSLEPLSIQLGEIKAICDILFQAKVNSLDNLRRSRVSSDDYSGQQTDYLEKKSVTNELGVISYYELTFRCFSSDLASVLAGFASSPYGLLVRAVNVEVAPSQAPSEPLQPVTMLPVSQQMAVPTTKSTERDAAFARRYGLPGGGGRYGNRPNTPAPQPAVVQPQFVSPTPAASANRGGLQTVLDEKQLKVTLTVYVIKLAPPK